MDNETGDVLMPLFYMKTVLEANYSRKLSSLKHRRVVGPPDAPWLGPDAPGVPHWQWAFESPPHVKTIVRQELGEDLMPQARPAFALRMTCCCIFIFAVRRIISLTAVACQESVAGHGHTPRVGIGDIARQLLHVKPVRRHVPGGVSMPQAAVLGAPFGRHAPTGVWLCAGPPAAGAGGNRVQCDGAEGGPALAAAVPRAVGRHARVDLRPAAHPPAGRPHGQG